MLSRRRVEGTHTVDVARPERVHLWPVKEVGLEIALGAGVLDPRTSAAPGVGTDLGVDMEVLGDNVVRW